MTSVSTFVRSLFGLCDHHWKEDARFDMGLKSHVDSRIVATWTRVECTCTKCGLPRKFDLK